MLNMNLTNQGTTESQYVRVRGFMDYELAMFAGGDDSMLKNDYYTDRKEMVENFNQVSQYSYVDYTKDWSSEHRDIYI